VPAAFSSEPSVGKRVREQSRILQVLRADAEDDRPSLVGPQRGMGTHLLVGDDDSLASDWTMATGWP
jgi:hypothetical protein